MRQSAVYARYESLVPIERFYTNSPTSALWECRDYAPSEAARNTNIPLICLPGLSGTCDVFWRVVLELVPRGVRIITVTIPPVWTVESFVDEFAAFLDRRRIRTAHLLGTNLGSLLAAAFYCARPTRVASLLLSSPFVDTQPFVDSAPALVRAGRLVLRTTPAVVVRRLVLSAFATPAGRAAEAATEYMCEEVERLTGAALASRLLLNCTPYFARPPMDPNAPEPARVTLLHAVDDPAVTPSMLDLAAATFASPQLRRAELKTGGAFPFLAAAADFAMHIVVHLRACDAAAEASGAAVPTHSFCDPPPAASLAPAPAAAPAAAASSGDSPGGGGGGGKGRGKKGGDGGGVELSAVVLPTPVLAPPAATEA